MTKYCCHCLASCIAIFTFLGGHCQSTGGDSTFYYSALKNVKAVYFSALKEKVNLYNGASYDAYGHGITGTPFFVADTMVNGSVFYDGFLYENVPLKLDMVNDELLSVYYYDKNILQLVKEKVSYFSVMGHNFIRLDKNEQDATETSGFCEVLYNDKKILVLAKRIKKLQMSTNVEDRSSVFKQYDQYFIYKDNKYFPVNSEDDLLKIFSDKAQDIKKFMRTKKIRYKKNAEQAILAATLFYNGSTK